MFIGAGVNLEIVADGVILVEEFHFFFARQLHCFSVIIFFNFLGMDVSNSS